MPSNSNSSLEVPAQRDWQCCILLADCQYTDVIQSCTVGHTQRRRRLEMIRWFSLVLLFLEVSSNIAHAQSFKITGSIPIGGTGHWDYLLADTANRRLYVSHNAEGV